MTSDVHVLPVNDLREHEESRDCWCEPTCESGTDGDAVVVIHHSLDGRELIEAHGLQ